MKAFAGGSTQASLLGPRATILTVGMILIPSLLFSHFFLFICLTTLARIIFTHNDDDCWL
jgi:hypothetical protein